MEKLSFEERYPCKNKSGLPCPQTIRCGFGESFSSVDTEVLFTFYRQYVNERVFGIFVVAFSFADLDKAELFV